MKIAAPKLTATRLCGAPRRGGKGLCCRPASAGKTRCRLHGADATGPTTEAGKAAAVAAMVAGRARWIEKQRELKAAGKIARCPGGRPSREGSPGRSERDSLTCRVAADGAVTVATEPTNLLSVVSSAVAAPTPTVKPWAAKWQAEKLDSLTTSALETLKDILDLPTALGDTKMLSLQKDAALSVIGARIKVSAGQMQKDRTADLNELLRCFRAGETPLFLDQPRRET